MCKFFKTFLVHVYDMCTEKPYAHHTSRLVYLCPHACLPAMAFTTCRILSAFLECKFSVEIYGAYRSHVGMPTLLSTFVCDFLGEITNTHLQVRGSFNHL
jgi:hypothetical protein